MDRFQNNLFDFTTSAASVDWLRKLSIQSRRHKCLITVKTAVCFRLPALGADESLVKVDQERYWLVKISFNLVRY